MDGQSLAERGPGILRRVGWSALAFLAGWLAGAAVFVVVFPDEADGWAHEHTVIAIGMSMFAGPAWLLSMLPLSIVLPAWGWPCRKWIAPIFGAVMGGLAMVLEFGLSGIGFVFRPGLLIPAGVTGVVAWTSFTAWLRHASAVTRQAPARLS